MGGGGEGELHINAIGVASLICSKIQGFQRLNFILMVKEGWGTGQMLFVNVFKLISSMRTDKILTTSKGRNEMQEI